MNYQLEASRPFLRIVVATPNLVATARGLLSLHGSNAQWVSADRSMSSIHMHLSTTIAERRCARGILAQSATASFLLVRWPGLLEKEGARIECMDSRQHYFTTYESNVLYALRFMVDCGVVGLAGGPLHLVSADPVIWWC